MAVKDWSTTASNNTAPGSVNFQESQLPSTLNNSMRQVLADMRTHFENGGWIQLHTTVFASSTTFTVASVDVRTTYAVGRRVRAVGSSTGTIYGVITVTAFSSNTTVTVVWDSGNLSSETLAISVSTQDQNGHVDAAMILSGTLNNNRLDADIKAIANLTSAADKLPYFTGSGSADVATFTAAGRALLDDANASAQLTTLGALPLAGGTMTGDLVLDGAPDADLKAATKAYVDNVAGSATDAAASAVTAANFAVKVNGAAAGSDFSAKAHAIGGTGVTDATGSAKEWATEVEDNTVAGSNTFSALHHSAKAAAQATAAASSASTASGHATTAQAAAQGWGAVTTITGATTNLEVADARDYYILDASSNTVTINLPAIGSSDGLLFGFQVHNVDNAISIVRDGSDRINGSAGNYAGLVAVGQVIHFIADNASPDNWLATIVSQSSDATTSAKGVASFSADNFAVSSGVVTIKAGGIVEAEIANDAVGLAQMKAGVDGNIISFDSSGNPVAIATGNDGQVLTSAGAGAQPAFEDAAGGGGTTFLDQVEASSSSTLAVSNMNGSNFSGYILTISDMVTSSTGAELQLRAVQAGGTYTSATYNHNISQINVGVSAGGLFNKFGGINIGYWGIAEDVNDSINASFLISTEDAAPVWMQGAMMATRTSDSRFIGGPWMGYIGADLTLTGMILSLNTGNITKGTMTLTGIKNA